MSTGNPAWDEARIQELIDGAVEESLLLDYKAAEALKKTDGKKKEITKDISAMANSAGGVVLYGVKEFDDPSKKHLPKRLDPVDRTQFSRETLEQVINNIRPRVDGLVIHAVPLAGADTHVAYVVEIPQSETAHQATDGRYYKRYNFQSVQMYDHEIRDVMGRATYPRIELEFVVEQSDEAVMGENQYSPTRRTVVGHRPRFDLVVRARNHGRRYAQYVNAFLVLPTAILRPPPFSGENTDWPDEDERSCQNTTRDVVDVKGGLDNMRRVYGPSRYEPILPGLSLRLTSYELVGDFRERLSSPELALTWKVYADNAPVVNGEVKLVEVEVEVIHD